MDGSGNGKGRRFNVYSSAGSPMTENAPAEMLAEMLGRYSIESFPLRVEPVMDPCDVNDFESLWDYTMANGRASKQLRNMDCGDRWEIHDFLKDYYVKWDAYGGMAMVNDYRTQAREDTLSDLINDLTWKHRPGNFSDILDALDDSDATPETKSMAIRLMLMLYKYKQL